MPKKIDLPAAEEHPSRVAGIINAARSALSPARLLRSQQHAAHPPSSSQPSLNPRTPHPPNAGSHRDAISAAHPPSAGVEDTPIHSMRRLLPVRPPSPPNQSNDESDYEEDEDDDDESLPATQPPDVAFPDTAPMPPSVFADKNKDYEPPDDSDYPPIPTKISPRLGVLSDDILTLEWD